MIRRCAWCKAEGRSGVLGMVGDPADPRETTDICALHAAVMLAAAANLPLDMNMNKRDTGLEEGR